MAIKSMPLSKRLKNDLIHRCWVKMIEVPETKLVALEGKTAMRIYNIIYGPHKRKLANLPEQFFSVGNTIPISCVTVRHKKGKRVKGQIEASKFTEYDFPHFHYADIDMSSPMRHHQDLRLPEPLIQYASHHVNRYGNTLLQRLCKLDLISGDESDEAESVYIEACNKAKEIYQPLVDVIMPIATILDTCKTTKGLVAAWPEAEEFLELPTQTAGPLVSVNIGALNANLKALQKEQARV